MILSLPSLLTERSTDGHRTSTSNIMRTGTISYSTTACQRQMVSWWGRSNIVGTVASTESLVAKRSRWCWSCPTSCRLTSFAHRVLVCRHDPAIPAEYAIRDMRGRERRARKGQILGKRKKAMGDEGKENLQAKEAAILALRDSSSPDLVDCTNVLDRPSKKRRVCSDLSVAQSNILPLTDKRSSRSRSSASRSSSIIPID